jgi:hypothetical protein
MAFGDQGALFTNTFQKFAKKTYFFFIPGVFTASSASPQQVGDTIPFLKKPPPGP